MWEDRLEAVRKSYDIQTVAPTNIKAWLINLPNFVVVL